MGSEGRVVHAGGRCLGKAQGGDGAFAAAPRETACVHVFHSPRGAVGSRGRLAGSLWDGIKSAGSDPPPRT